MKSNCGMSVAKKRLCLRWVLISVSETDQRRNATSSLRSPIVYVWYRYRFASNLLQQIDPFEYLAMAAPSTNASKNKQTLGSLLHHFIGTVVTVEQKTGRSYQGILAQTDEQMNLTLQEAALLLATRKKSSQHQRPSQPPHTHTHQNITSGTTTTSASAPETLSFAIVHIRGSTIRYVHFPGQVDLGVVVKQGMDRERAAAQKYKRGIRK